MKKFLAVLLLLSTLTTGVLSAKQFIPKSDLIYIVLDKVKRGYVDQKRVQPEKMLKGALERLSAMLAPVLTRVETDDARVTVHVSVDQYSHKQSYSVPKNLEDLNHILQDVARFTKQHLEKEDKHERVDYALINGALTKLDPHTFLLVPELYSSFSTEAKGNFGGVGMMIGIQEGALTIISPIDDTPTSRAGLKAMDKIVQIDGESTINLPLNEAVKKIRGKVGTQVKLHIMREGFSVPKVYNITRAIIKINSVESHVLEDQQGRVGYIKIKTFQRNTLKEMNQHLEDMGYDFSDFKGLILDLRNNPGGFLDQAIGISDRFLDEGVIVSTAGVDSRNINSFKAHWYGTIKNLPLIVLVNDGSASASEIVSAALKKNKRAVVIGSTTYGKGSVQQVLPMKDGSALKITTSKYLTPGNISIQSVGVTPNIDVIPYYVSDKYLRVTAQKEADKEDSLKENFAEWGDQAEAPDQVIHHLYEEEKDKDKALKDEDSKVAKIKRLKKDFIVQLSKNVLLKNKKRSYDALYASVVGVLEGEDQREEKKLVEKLASFSTPVDWSAGVTTGEVRVKSDVWVELKKVTKKGKKETVSWKRLDTDIPANSEIRIVVKAENIGTHPIYRLLANTSSENRVLKNRQFAFGKLSPGESKTWSVPVKIMEAAISQSNLVNLKFQDISGDEVHADTYEFNVKETYQPSFLYALQFIEDGTHGSKGNGDGILQPGERVAVKTTVKNAGQGKSGNVTVIFKNGEGRNIFLKKGRQSMKSIGKGKTSDAYFLFDVKNVPLDDTWDFSLDILDSTFQLQSVNQKVKLAALTPSKRIKNQAPEIQVQTDKRVSSSTRMNLKGVIKDQGGVKDFFIFANNKKIFYNNLVKRQSRHSVDFSLDIELKEGVNQLIIVSRDDYDVRSQKTILVRH